MSNATSRVSERRAADFLARRDRVMANLMKGTGPFHPPRPPPEAVWAVPPGKLRAAGLSGRKVVSMRDLAAKVVDGTVPLHRIGRLADEEVITRLSVVRGIGRWTAEMFLMFQLRRLDVWPVGDYGIRKGYALAYGLRKLLTPKQLAREGERFRPYRTVAAWYCWQAVREQRKLRKGHSPRGP